jgi:hypothetical protein
VIRSRPLAVGCVLLAVLCALPVTVLWAFLSFAFAGDRAGPPGPLSWIAWDSLTLALTVLVPPAVAVAVSTLAAAAPHRRLVAKVGILAALALFGYQWIRFA